MSAQSPILPSDPLDRIQGALLGVALADAWGAPHEGGPLEGLLWRVIGTRQGRRQIDLARGAEPLSP
ncbi:MULTISPECIES: hypothetical protein [Thiorhodovibrio]|uniref:hypothetical protein n=1 Tax=Thiorhodovibrio TaxID=61593 RepID=UPI0019120D6C|nr:MULTISPECIES: hypothetical protein [Thiorhodovibrio]MBK5969306.1 hypothetical protein [Thiorhodovibrio winogradskyi]WPL11944.1 hypothetical protein Thiosp_01697 [Thiorhodovibrio litoralis]